MISAINSALSGLNAASLQVAASASNIANSSDSSYKGLQVTQTAQADGGVAAQVSQTGSSPDQTQDLVNVQSALNNYQADATVLKVSEKLQQSFLDVIA